MAKEVDKITVDAVKFAKARHDLLRIKRIVDKILEEFLESVETEEKERGKGE